MEFIMELILKSTLMLLVVTSLLFLLRRASAVLRHVLISGGMLMLLVFPLMMLLLPDWEVLPLTIEQQMMGADKGSSGSLSYPLIHTMTSASTASISDRVEQSVAEKTAPETVPQNRAKMAVEVQPHKVLNWKIALLLVWLMGVLIFLIRLGKGLIFLLRLQGGAVEYASFNGNKLSVVLSELQTSPELSILVHRDINTPMTWHLPQPLILLPIDALEWTRDELKLVLTHELIHIQRRDFLMHLISLIAISLYWYHPLVWYLKKQLLLEREKACDELVVQKGINPVDYAETLLAITRKLIVSKMAIPTLAIQMAQVSMIKRRIEALLKHPTNHGSWPYPKWVLFTLSALALPLLAAIRPAAQPFGSHFSIIENGESGLPALRSATSSQEVTDLPVLPTLGETGNDNNLQLQTTDPEILPSLHAKLLSDQLKLETLPALPLQTLHRPEPERLEMRVPATIQSEGLYGNWQDGRSHFQVWINGEFHFTATAPYVEVDNPDGMIIIEEERGGKTYQLTITKAPYEGGLIQTYRDGQPNAWSGIMEGDPFYMWKINGEWSFLWKGLDRWMGTQMEVVRDKMRKLDDPVWQHVKNEEEQWLHWKSKIEVQELLKATRFIRRDELPVWYETSGYGVNVVYQKILPEFDLAALPVRTTNDTASTLGSSTTIGATSATRTTNGGTGMHNQGARYGRVFRSKGIRGKLRDFNFHLGHNLCRRATLKLYLYQLKDDLPEQRLTASPVVIEIDKEDGWITKDLRSLDLSLEGDILAVIEIDHFQGNGRENGGLFFSYAKSTYDGLPENSYSWNFSEFNMAANLTVEQAE
ncbi:MAG: M56 family metallopeptidase [Lewinella sp.]|nr:M56 family metallopeptidase [Lewinella sp.]